MFRRYSLALLNCLALAGTTFAGVWGTIFSSTMELKALIVSTIALSSLISFAVSVSSSREVAFTRTALSSILANTKPSQDLRDALYADLKSELRSRGYGVKRSFYLADGDIYYITALSDPSQEKYAMILVIDEDIRTQAYAQFAAGRSLKSTVRRSLYQPVGLPTTDSQLRSFLHRLSILGWFVVSHALELRGMVSEVERGLDFEGPSITIVSKNAPHVTASLGPEILNKCLRLPPGEAAAIAYYRMVEQMVAQLGRISTSHL